MAYILNSWKKQIRNFGKLIIAISIYVILSLIIILFANVATAEKPIKMGYFFLPPHHYIDSDSSKPIGSGINLFETLASKMGSTVKWVGPFPIVRLFRKIESGEIDGTISIPKFDELMKNLYFTKKQIFNAKPILIVRKETFPGKLNSVESIKGWQIGTLLSETDIYTPFIDENRNMITLHKLGNDNWAELNLKKLLIGRLDAVFDRNQFTVPFIAATMKVDSQIKVLYIPDTPTPLYICFSKASKRGQILTKKFDSALSQLNFNYEQMAQKEIDEISN